jgi:hypothetical protein
MPKTNYNGTPIKWENCRHNGHRRRHTAITGELQSNKINVNHTPEGSVEVEAIGCGHISQTRISVDIKRKR